MIPPHIRAKLYETASELHEHATVATDYSTAITARAVSDALANMRGSTSEERWRDAATWAARQSVGGGAASDRAHKDAAAALRQAGAAALADDVLLETSR